MENGYNFGDLSIGKGFPLLLIAGPCVIEDYENTFNIAKFLKELALNLKISFVFKASYDKANRTSIDAYRGPGINKGLKILQDIKKKLNIKIISDVHQISDVALAASVLDIIQIPAFLCRQTDLVCEVAKTNKPINIKKGQFLAPNDVENIAKKVFSTGNKKLTITERGVTFGYNNLVVDFRGIKIIQNFGLPVIFDATHSVQIPGGQGSCSGGNREFAPILARAAVAAGADGVFLEVHNNPDKALCDGPNSMKLDELDNLILKLKSIKQIVEK